MDMSIKSHILENFKNDDESSIRDAIISSINENDDVVLPGMGIFLTLLWNESDDELKEIITKLIKKGIANSN